MEDPFDGPNYQISESFFSPEHPHGGVCLMFPGQNYATTMPAMAFLKQALAQNGWRVVESDWDFPAVDNLVEAREFIEKVADEAVDFAKTWLPDPVNQTILVTKSISSLLAPWAKERGLSGVWLTPQLNLREAPETLIADALAATSPPQLLIGGSADQSWSEESAKATNKEVVSLTDANHTLLVPDDWEASLAILRKVVDVSLEFTATARPEQQRN